MTAKTSIHFPAELLTPIITHVLVDHFTYLLDEETAAAAYSLDVRLKDSSLERTAKSLAAISHAWLHHVVIILLKYRAKAIIHAQESRITKLVGSHDVCGHGNIIQQRMFNSCVRCLGLRRVVVDCTTLAGRLIALEKEYGRVERYRAVGMSATRALAMVWQEERVECVLYHSSMFAIREYQNDA